MEHVLDQEAGDATALRWAWSSLAIGSAAVIAISVAYFLAPPLAVSPNLGATMPLARTAALSDHGHLRVVGVLGALADPAIAVGAFALAHRAGRGTQAIGLYWLATAALLFTFVDVLAGFALVASAHAGIEAFSVTKPLFDALTACAAFAYGLSAILIAWRPTAVRMLGPPGLMLALGAVGVAVAVSGVLVLLALDAGLALGLGLAVLSTLFALLGVRNSIVERAKQVRVG